MQVYVVTLGKAGGGAGTFKATIPAATPAEARTLATHQYPGYVAHSVKAV
jgi:hypothetical protein